MLYNKDRMNEVTMRYSITGKGSHHLEQIRGRPHPRLDFIPGVSYPLLADPEWFILEYLENSTATRDEIKRAIEPRLRKYGGFGTRDREKTIIDTLRQLIHKKYIEAE